MIEILYSEFAVIMEGAEDVDAAGVGDGFAAFGEALVVEGVEVFFREGHFK